MLTFYTLFQMETGNCEESQSLSRIRTAKIQQIPNPNCVTLSPNIAYSSLLATTLTKQLSNLLSKKTQVEGQILL